MSKRVQIVKIPENIGGRSFGPSLAPDAIESAGLSSKLQSLGYAVDVDSVTFHFEGKATWQKEPVPVLSLQYLEEAYSAVIDIENSLLRMFHRIKSDLEKTFFIFLGPDGISQPILTTVHNQLTPQRTGLIRFDNHADMILEHEPAAYGSFEVLDSQSDGGLEVMNDLAKPDGPPPRDNSNTVLFGLNVTKSNRQRFVQLLNKQYRYVTGYKLQRGDATELATDALRYLEQRVDKIVVHFDVNVISHGEFPLGNYPSYGPLSYKKAMEALKVFLASEKVFALMITEVNPNNDPDGSMVNKLVDGVIEGFADRVKKEHAAEFAAAGKCARPRVFA